MWVETLGAFILGLLFGSFGNVVIFRYPKGLNIALPRSRCPQCHTAIAWYDNIPLLSWLILRGRCRKCQAPISWRYPAVELITGLLFAALIFRYGISWLTLEY